MKRKRWASAPYAAAAAVLLALPGLPSAQAAAGAGTPATAQIRRVRDTGSAVPADLMGSNAPLEPVSPLGQGRLVRLVIRAGSAGQCESVSPTGPDSLANLVRSAGPTRPVEPTGQAGPTGTEPAVQVKRAGRTPQPAAVEPFRTAQESDSELRQQLFDAIYKLLQDARVPRQDMPREILEVTPLGERHYRVHVAMVVGEGWFEVYWDGKAWQAKGVNPPPVPKAPQRPPQ